MKRGVSLGVCVFDLPTCALSFSVMGSPKIPLLTPYNYATWKVNAWSKLMEKDLNNYVDDTIS